MPEQISMDQMLQKLREYVDACPSQNEAARQLGISASFLSDMLNDVRKVSDRVAVQLGYSREVVFKAIER